MSEFCLSDKWMWCAYCEHGCDEPHKCKDNLMMYVDDVKQFIKELKEEFENNDWDNNTLDVEKNRNKIIDTLAGEGLI